MACRCMSASRRLAQSCYRRLRIISRGYGFKVVKPFPGVMRRSTMSLFSRIADHRDPGSLASRLRQRRHEFFLKLLETLPRPISILDVGGTSTFWKNLALKADDARIVLLTVFEQSPESPNMRSIAGDARDLRQFADNSFD